MRIVSQDGCYDIPYEQVMLQRYKENIYLMNRNLCGVEGIVEDPIIAKYSTKEKAIKAMEMCRKHYATAEYNRRIIPKGDTLVDMEIVKELLTSGFIFQFPADDEI